MTTPVAPAAPAAPAAGSSAPPASSAAPAKANPQGGVPPVKPTTPNSAATGSKSVVPAKPEGTTPPVVPQKFKRKEKIDGQEVELEADEDALWAAYRQQRTVNQRFEQAAQQRKEIAEEKRRVEQMYADLAGDPTGEKLFEQYQKAHPEADPVEVLSAILQKRLHEEEQLNDPNIRERRRLERENQTFREREAAAKQEQVTAHQKAQTAAELERLGGLFREALEVTKLPKNDITVRLMAEAEYTNRQNGSQLSPQQLAKATEKAMHSIVEATTTDESITDEQCLDMYPALTKRIHRGLIARHKARQSKGAGQPPDITPRSVKPAQEDANKPRTMTSKEEHDAYGLGKRSLRTI